jgi:S1-C subfamily serine protease
MTPEAIENLKGKIKATVDVGSGAFLGVQGMTSGNQAIVAKVVAESAADKAGIRENDIIAKINGEEIKDFLAMKDLIAQHEPGDSVMFTILRPRPNEMPETLELKVTFAQWGIKGAGAVTPINMGREVNTLPKLDLHKFRLDRR